MKVAIIGAGSWGSALAIAIAKVARSVLLYVKSEEESTIINHSLRNNYLPDGVFFSRNIKATNDFSKLVGSNCLIIATPIKALVEVLNGIKSTFKDSIPDLIWACKGFEPSSLKLPHEVVEEFFNGICKNYGALLGPSFASEVANGLPTAITFTANSKEFSIKYARLFSQIPNFKVYANNDIIGAQVGAALKNVIAIACGINDGLSLGNNARSALMTRGLNEMKELTIALGGHAETLYGLSGVGDLILTCSSTLSRNKVVGMKLASGMNLDSILKELGQVAEGVETTNIAYQLSKKFNIEMPITEALYDIIYKNANIKELITCLLSRKVRFES